MKRPLALLLVLSAAPISAQPGLDYSVEETRRMMHDYALCVIKRKKSEAAKVILANLPNSTIVEQHRSLLIPDCVVSAATFGASMRFPGDMYRYALADALVSTELAAVIPQDLGSVPLLEHFEFDPKQFEPKPGKRISKRRAEELAQSRNQAIVYSYFSRFGECVVRKDARGAHALLMTKPTKPEEAAAFRALVPVFGACLEAGRKFSANRMVMRGMIAINYYRLAKAPRSVAAGVQG